MSKAPQAPLCTTFMVRAIFAVTLAISGAAGAQETPSDSPFPPELDLFEDTETPTDAVDPDEPTSSTPAAAPQQPEVVPATVRNEEPSVDDTKIPREISPPPATSAQEPTAITGVSKAPADGPPKKKEITLTVSIPMSEEDVDEVLLSIGYFASLSVAAVAGAAVGAIIALAPLTLVNFGGLSSAIAFPLQIPAFILGASFPAISTGLVAFFFGGEHRVVRTIGAVVGVFGGALSTVAATGGYTLGIGLFTNILWQFSSFLPCASGCIYVAGPVVILGGIATTLCVAPIAGALVGELAWSAWNAPDAEVPLDDAAPRAPATSALLPPPTMAF